MTQAARVLHRTQPAISQQIQSLEKEVGFALFQKKGRRPHVTPEGQALYESAHEHLGQIDRQLALLRHENQAPQGLVRIGVVTEYAIRVVHPKIRVLRTLYPGIQLEVQQGSDTSIEAMLMKDQIDIGILVLLKEQSPFTTRICLAEECMVFASKEYIERSGPFDTFDSISQADLIDYSDRFTCLGYWMVQNIGYIPTAMSHGRPCIVYPDDYAIKELVLEHLGIGMLPYRLVHQEVQQGRLIQLIPDSKNIQILVQAAVVKKRLQKRIIQQVLDILAPPEFQMDGSHNFR